MLSVGLKKGEGVVITKDGSPEIVIALTKRKGCQYINIEAPKEYGIHRSSKFLDANKEYVNEQFGNTDGPFNTMELLIDEIKRRT